MAATSYRKISEQIRTMLGSGIVSDDFRFSLRYIAELVAQEVAFEARKDAFESSNAGETTFANDAFISTFTNVAVLYDSTLNQKYSVMPSTPISLPKGQEIASITPLGIIGRRRQIIPMQNKDKFMQDLLEPVRGAILAYRENGRIYYDNINQYMFTAVNISMVGAISTTGSLLDGELNVPKNVESAIIDRVTTKLRQLGSVPQDVMNDARDLPTAQ
jgi:hypothetical protein